MKYKAKFHITRKMLETWQDEDVVISDSVEDVPGEYYGYVLVRKHQDLSRYFDQGFVVLDKDFSWIREMLSRTHPEIKAGDISSYSILQRYIHFPDVIQYLVNIGYFDESDDPGWVVTLKAKSKEKEVKS